MKSEVVVLAVLVTSILALLALGSPVLADPIHDSAAGGDLAAVRALLAQDPALANAKDSAGRTPLHFAVDGGHVDVAQLLAEAGADPDAKDLQATTPLAIAAVRGQEEMVDLLIKQGAGLEVKNDYGRTPLVLAAREMGGIGVIRKLVDAGADITSKDNYDSDALELAAWRGSKDVVDFLLEKGAALPVDDRRAGLVMGSAVSHGLTNLFFKLQDRVTDFEFEGDGGGGLIHTASAGGSAEIMRVLIDRGLDINERDPYDWTPLHYAADNGRAEAINLLLDRGADLNARNLMGQTALVIARDNDDKGTVDLLLARGADPGEPAFPTLEGPYLGQPPPGRQPQVFAPGIVTGHYGLHSCIVFSPDGREAIWSLSVPPRGEGYGQRRTMTSRLAGNRWTYPRRAVYGEFEVEDVPFFSPDGQRLYDMASRQVPGKAADKENIWLWEKTAGEWSSPRPLPPVINDLRQHWQFSLDRAGNVYFASRTGDTRGRDDIYCSRLVAGQYEAPVNQGDAINTDGSEGTPFVAPDGSYLVFSRNADLYVSFKRDDGTWSEAQSLGESVNTPGPELCPTVTADGKYLFYLAGHGIYWVDAGIIYEMKGR